jgi:hypothetical protein
VVAPSEPFVRLLLGAKDQTSNNQQASDQLTDQLQMYILKTSGVDDYDYLVCGVQINRRFLLDGTHSGSTATIGRLINLRLLRSSVKLLLQAASGALTKLLLWWTVAAIGRNVHSQLFVRCGKSQRLLQAS